MPTLNFFGEGTLLCYFLANLKKETTKISSVSVAGQEQQLLASRRYEHRTVGRAWG